MPLDSDDSGADGPSLEAEATGYPGPFGLVSDAHGNPLYDSILAVLRRAISST